MALKAALIITGIAIGLLALYGADVGVSKGSDQGFLPFDHKTRGVALGGAAMILPIIGFFISRKEPSKTLAIMLFVAGIMIIVGGIVFLTSTPSAEALQRNPMTETAPLFGVGAFQIALGAIKIRK
jgi:cytochrome oxidase Cu insertion factor (SCO1/SenC/PrrC family)